MTIIVKIAEIKEPLSILTDEYEWRTCRVRRGICTIFLNRWISSRKKTTRDSIAIFCFDIKVRFSGILTKCSHINTRYSYRKGTRRIHATRHPKTCRRSLYLTQSAFPGGRSSIFLGVPIHGSSEGSITIHHTDHPVICIVGKDDCIGKYFGPIADSGRGSRLTFGIKTVIGAYRSRILIR